MSDTKTCNLTEEELKATIDHYMHGGGSLGNLDYRIDRINYLNKRLKAFKEVEKEPITADTDALNPNNQQIKEPAKW